MESVTGHVVIVMAPMGSGKGTLVTRALETFPSLTTTVSCTTREPRAGEVNGREYHFISAAEFSEKVAAGDFLEWATFGLNRYGTLKSEIIPKLEAGMVVIAEIEVQGVEQLHALIPSDHMTTVYIEAGGWEVLRARALARAPMSDAELAKRYERFLVERESKNIADVIIDNSTNDSSIAERQFINLITTIYDTVTD